jgi:hypothetical protein
MAKQLSIRLGEKGAEAVHRLLGTATASEDHHGKQRSRRRL